MADHSIMEAEAQHSTCDSRPGHQHRFPHNPQRWKHPDQPSISILQKNWRLLRTQHQAQAQQRDLTSSTKGRASGSAPWEFPHPAYCGHVALAACLHTCNDCHMTWHSLTLHTCIPYGSYTDVPRHGHPIQARHTAPAERAT